MVPLHFHLLHIRQDVRLYNTGLLESPYLLRSLAPLISFIAISIMSTEPAARKKKMSTETVKRSPQDDHRRALALSLCFYIV